MAYYPKAGGTPLQDYSDQVLGSNVQNRVHKTSSNYGSLDYKKSSKMIHKRKEFLEYDNGSGNDKIGGSSTSDGMSEEPSLLNTIFFEN